MKGLDERWQEPLLSLKKPVCSLPVAGTTQKAAFEVGSGMSLYKKNEKWRFMETLISILKGRKLKNGQFLLV